MPHIQLPDGEPGITGLMVAYRDTEQHLNGLTQAAMRGPSTLTEAEREVIAAYVSARNDCVF